MTIIEDRLTPDIVLKWGSHSADSGEMCLLEAVAWIAGERWSDHPECVCPTLAAFGRTWNDGLPDDETRTRLLAPFLPRLVGTRSTPKVQDARAFMAADWAVRVFVPAWLRRAGLVEDAEALEALPELSTVKSCEAAMPFIWKAGDAAWPAASDAARAAAGAAAWAAAWPAAGDAARAAARAAAGAAAWDAAGAAAWAAARAAARAAAGAAAWDAAWDAAGDAARDAAGNAAGDALAETVAELQRSASDLFDRMIKAS